MKMNPLVEVWIYIIKDHIPWMGGLWLVRGRPVFFRIDALKVCIFLRVHVPVERTKYFAGYLICDERYIYGFRHDHLTLS